MIFITKETDVNMQVPLQSLYFYASWIPFHKKFLLMISKIEEKYHMPFFAIDIDQFPQIAKKFSVKSIPVVLVLKKGEELNRIEGLVLTSAFKSFYVDIYNKETSNQ
jgi:thioredoxin-like negative regulator of GroEL